MRRTDVIVIGGGQAGLAASRCLSGRGIDHAVLERGRVGERWRSERWPTLRLLTPNWQSRLPGWSYRGPDPDGYMSMPEVIAFLEEYARSFDAPVEEGTTVLAVAPCGDGFRVDTDRGTWRAAQVVVATGACDRPHVPSCAAGLSPRIHPVAPPAYRGPQGLPPGGVLVVGASASGIQIADELHAAGREVTVAVGRHTRLPRTYRGRDVLDWLDAVGILDERPDDVLDLERSRRQPSFQLVGRPDRRTLDLGTLRASGVRLAGRLAGIEGTTVTFAPDLPDTLLAADAKLARLLDRIDRFAASCGLPCRPEPVPALRPVTGPEALDLDAERISTVVWATGYRREYPWLQLPVLDARGEIRHEGGVTPVPGLSVLGLPFLRRRNSSFLDGVGKDAVELTARIAVRLERRATAA